MSNFFDLFKRLILGLALIAGSAGILLWSDLESRIGAKSTSGLKRIAIVQNASQPIMEDGFNGITESLKTRGYIDGQNIAIKRFNAEQDIGTANSIAKEVTSGSYDMIISMTTVSLQTIASANKTGKKVDHVYGFVSNPPGAGVGIDPKDLSIHPPYMVGYGTMQPIKEAFELIKKMNPGLTKLGLVWNSAEANSVAQTNFARKVAPIFGITLMEANAENSTAVSDAAASLVSRGVEAIWVSGDVTVLVAADAVIEAARRGRIPVITVIPPSVKKGALLDVGGNYTMVGRAMGMRAADILDGHRPSEYRAEFYEPKTVTINKKALKGLKGNWSIPAKIEKRASLIIDDAGEHKIKQPEDLPTDATKPEEWKNSGTAKASTEKMFKVRLVQFADTPLGEIDQQGIIEGLRQSGIEEGKNLELKVRNAQGDMATLQTAMTASLAEKPDVLITSTTPALISAVQRSTPKDKVVFSLIANPIIAKAGTSDTDHRPNLTGTYVPQPSAEALDILVKLRPGIRKIGTLYTPSEANSVYYRDTLAKLAKERNIELISIGCSSSSDVADAALALCAKKPDVITQLVDNQTTVSFTSIANAAKATKTPLLSFGVTRKDQGVFLTVCRDWYIAGIESGKLAARVAKGESPANIPFKFVPNIQTTLNLPNANYYGIDVSDAFVKSCKEVIR
ncbi:MAG: ABC transporter substrate-binding protein [Armatimonadota bacterium]